MKQGGGNGEEGKGFASFKKLNVFIPSKEIQSLKIGEILIREIRNTSEIGIGAEAGISSVFFKQKSVKRRTGLAVPDTKLRDFWLPLKNIAAVDTIYQS